MSFSSLFKFAVKCFDVLAWPLISLVYPLCASIRAIESDSSSNSNNLAAYWVLFSLVFIFEQAFVKLLEWVPFWYYIKLIAWCWLVIPNFEGAFYVYKHLLHPCLFTVKSDHGFVTTAENKHVKENDPQDMKAVEITENQLVAAVNPDKANGATESREITEIPDDSNIVQKKWTCAICQVTTSSETTLNSHLQGRRHNEKCRNLNAKFRQAQRLTKENASGSKNRMLQENLNNDSELSKSRVWLCTLCNISCSSFNNLDSHFSGKKHLAQLEELCGRV